jgi:hypothetical protein
MAPDSYHHTLWSAQSAVYQEMWSYYDRSIFDETLSNKSDDKRYPLGINLFETACMNHRSCLFGEFEDDVLRFRVRSENNDGALVEKALSRIWRHSSINSILLESGMLCMVLGGVVFRVIWHPVHKRVYIRNVAADAFFPVWDPDDYHRLLEAFIVYQVDGIQATRRFHVKVDAGESLHTVQERWTQDFYEVRVDDEPAFWDDAKRLPMSGPNPYRDPLSGLGIIPVEYIPRDRGGDFYGVPLGKNIIGLQNAYNLSAADVSDAILDATHQYLFVKNRPLGTKGLEVLQRGKLMNLGMAPPGGDDPDVFAVKGGEIPQGTLDWLNEVKEMARESALTPPVSYGQDEGSQRSALTLAFRMWPLSSAVRASRGFWTDGLASLNRKAVIVAMTKGGYNLREGHADYEMLPMWASMLPRDREAEVNEAVVRKAAGLISVQNALGLLEEKEQSWIDEEEARIWEDANKQAEIEVKIAQAGFGGPGGGADRGPGPSSMPTS